MSSLNLARLNFQSASYVYTAAVLNCDYQTSVKLYAASQRAWFVYCAMLRQHVATT